jgi:O-antigen/teichoic acid export membrane protein
MMALIGICVNLVLNFILIPHYKAIGSAFSSLITQFFTAGIQIYFAYKIFKFNVNVKLLVSLLIFIIGIVGFNYFSKNITENWMINFVIMTAFCGLWAFVSGLLSIRSILKFIKYN